MINRRWLKFQCFGWVALAVLVPIPLAQSDEGNEVSIFFAQIKGGNKAIRYLADSELWSVSNEAFTEALPILKSALKDKEKISTSAGWLQRQLDA